MTNKYGLDVRYFEGKLKLILKDIQHFTPEEMYNALTRLADVAKYQMEDEK